MLLYFILFYYILYYTHNDMNAYNDIISLNSMNAKEKFAKTFKTCLFRYPKILSNFLFFVLLGLSASRAPVEGPSRTLAARHGFEEARCSLEGANMLWE